jgi:hypothetical protein
VRSFTEEAVEHAAWEDYGVDGFENPLLVHTLPTLERG